MSDTPEGAAPREEEYDPDFPPGEGWTHQRLAALGEHMQHFPCPLCNQARNITDVSPAPVPAPAEGAAPTIRGEEDIVRVARDEIYRLCVRKGGKTLNGLAGRDWSMSIPPHVDDSDVIFVALADECEALRKQLTALRADAERREAALREAMDWINDSAFDITRAENGWWIVERITLEDQCPTWKEVASGKTLLAAIENARRALAAEENPMAKYR